METDRVDGEQIRLLLRGSVENLLATWDDTLALFPYVSTLRGATICNDYDHPQAVRYTVNSLLGLVEACGSEAVDVSHSDVGAFAAAFLAGEDRRVELPADKGLATLLHCALGAGPSVLRARVRGLAKVLEHSEGAALNMQDLAWVLWGAAAARQAGIAEAVDVVRIAYRVILRDLVDDHTGLPRHSARRYRRDVVSFGSLTYFLRAMHEAAEALGETSARELFERGVARAMALQGPRGEWPWMIDARRGAAFDFYPVFSVHQDSMAMLFLLPALDRGLPGAERAIARSLAWVFGDNELGLPMFVERPFFAYRAIERAERATRVRRYARSVGHRLSSRRAHTGASRLRLNDECRSYHLGWVLYAWSNRAEALEGAVHAQAEARL